MDTTADAAHGEDGCDDAASSSRSSSSSRYLLPETEAPPTEHQVHTAAMITPSSASQGVDELLGDTKAVACVESPRQGQPETAQVSQQDRLDKTSSAAVDKISSLFSPALPAASETSSRHSTREESALSRRRRRPESSNNDEAPADGKEHHHQQAQVAPAMPELGTTNTTVDSVDKTDDDEFVVRTSSPDDTIQPQQQPKQQQQQQDEGIMDTSQTSILDETNNDDDCLKRAPSLEEKENSSSSSHDAEEEGTLLPSSSSSAASTPSSHTIVTEALSLADSESDNNTTTTAISMMDDSTAARQQQQDDDIMPRQPELLVASSSTTNTYTTEEEKAEVDEYDEHMVDAGVRAVSELPPNKDQGITARLTVDKASQHSFIPPVIENKRAEYVSATILKLESSHEHGLSFIMSVDGNLRISTISPTGLFAHSPLAPFDRMLRINNLNCETLDPVNAAHLLTHLSGAITVIAHNQGGASNLVESQITKPVPESRTGIAFRNKCIDEALLKDELEVTHIGSKSLFSSALLHVGDRVIAINNCSDLDRNMGDALLQSAPKHCVILARTNLKTQMAIARRPTHQLPPGFNFVRAMDEARRQREELQRKQGCYYNSCERPGACANIFQWLGNVYVITIVIVGISISWNTVKEETYDGSDAVGTILKFMGLFVGGILLGFLVNAPWWFRKAGARFSIAQLVCNVIVIATFFVLQSVFDAANLVGAEYGYAIFFGLFFPLLIIVNLPSVFVKREDGSDGNTISDRDPSDDEMSVSNSHISDMV